MPTGKWSQENPTKISHKVTAAAGVTLQKLHLHNPDMEFT